MDTAIAFITGGVFTLFVFAGGSILGALISSKKLEEKAQEIKNKLTPPPPQSGSVKAITPEEIKKEEQKGFINKMEGLISE